MIFIAGGGDERQSAAFDGLYETEVTSINPSPNCLYIPNATMGDNFTPMMNWFSGTYKFFDNIYLPNNIPEDIMPDSIYIGGGYCARLKEFLKSKRMDREFFNNALASGVTVYGGSAGGVVLGASLATGREIMNDPEQYAPDDMDGIDLCSGTSFLPHYDSSRMGAALHLAKSLKGDVMCLSESAGVVIDNQGKLVEAVGVKGQDVLRIEG